MKKSLALFAAAFALACALPVAARAATPTAPDVSDLPDGARLIVLPDPAAKETVVEVFFRVGQADEGQWHGIDALITRAWTSGSDNRSAVLLQSDISRHGDAIGTTVQPDFVNLWAVCAPDAFERTAQTLITNLVSAPLFAKSAVEAARGEQRDADALRADDVLTDVMDRLRSRAYGDSPYALPVMGSDETMRAIPAEQVSAHYRRYFRPDRAIIVVAGPVTPDAARHTIVGCIGAGGWDDAPTRSPATRPEAAEAIPSGLRDAVAPRRPPALYVAVGFLAPGVEGLKGRKDYATLLVLDAVLGGGKASRLFALRDRPASGETPIGYEIHTLLAPTRVQSLWIAYVIGTQPTGAVRDRLLAALHALADGTQPVTDDELARAKAYLKIRHAEARQTLKSRADGVGEDEALGLGADYDADYDAAIDNVPLDAVNHLARALFTGNPAVVHTLAPVAK